MAAMASLTARTAFAARRSSVVVAASRPIWYPGNDEVVPPYLDGELPGDYGFDPLRLADDPENRRWLVHSEIFHGRVAMTGVAGILYTSLANASGQDIPEWFDAGKVYAETHPDVPFGALVYTTFLLSGWAEAKRWQDYKKPGSQADGSFFGIRDEFKGTGNAYPGGKYFDFLGLSRGSEEQLRQYKIKEVKNGRLAMIAFLGFAAQYAATGKGPIDNLIEHITTGGAANFVTNGE
ncbi:hypothetical protein N2152v2_006182 [Parachlorella kessleri]